MKTVLLALLMVATALKRRAEAAEARSQSTEKDSRGVLVPPQCREVFQPIVVEERVTVVGVYLKQPVAVISHRHCDRLFVTLEHCDWVCKIVSGKGRGRTQFKEVRTLRNLRELAQRHLAEVFSASALAEDPVVAVDGSNEFIQRSMRRVQETTHVASLA